VSEHASDSAFERGVLDVQGVGYLIGRRVVDEHAEDRQILVVERCTRRLQLRA